MLIQFQLNIDSSNVDDLTTLETLNLLSIGISSYNYKLHVPSDISMDGYFVDNSNLKTQHYLEEINKRTNNQKWWSKQKLDGVGPPLITDPSTAEAPPIGKIQPFSKIALTLEPVMQFRCPSRLRIS